MNHPNILMYLKNLSEQKTVPAIDNIEYCTSILLELILELDEQLAKKSLLLQEQLKLSLTLPETEDTLQIFLPVQLCGKIHPPHFTSKYNLRESLHCQHQDIFEI